MPADESALMQCKDGVADNLDFPNLCVRMDGSPFGIRKVKNRDCFAPSHCGRDVRPIPRTCYQMISYVRVGLGVIEGWGVDTMIRMEQLHSPRTTTQD